MKRTAYICLLALSCAAPTRPASRIAPPDDPTKVRVCAASPALLIGQLDGNPFAHDKRCFLVLPGKHIVTGSYDSGIQRSLQDSTASFEAWLGQSVLLCMVSKVTYPSGKGTWSIYPLVGPSSAPVTHVRIGDYDPTCSLWQDVAVQSDLMIPDAIRRGALGTFKNVAGQTILQFARTNSSEPIVRKLSEAGFQ